jgi:hypothetical protein
MRIRRATSFGTRFLGWKSVECRVSSIEGQSVEMSKYIWKTI